MGMAALPFASVLLCPDSTRTRKVESLGFSLGMGVLERVLVRALNRLITTIVSWLCRLSLVWVYLLKLLILHVFTERVPVLSSLVYLLFVRDNKSSGR